MVWGGGGEGLVVSFYLANCIVERDVRQAFEHKCLSSSLWRKQTDKGRAIVILSYQDYIPKANKQF